MVSLEIRLSMLVSIQQLAHPSFLASTWNHLRYAGAQNEHDKPDTGCLRRP
jgi:hypothetical protein